MRRGRLGKEEESTGPASRGVTQSAAVTAAWVGEPERWAADRGPGRHREGAEGFGSQISL